MSYGIIFDMDGVLIDSHNLIWSSVNRVLGQYRVHLSDDDIKQYIGRSFKDDLKIWNEKYGLKLELKSFIDAVGQGEEDTLRGIKANPGLVYLLEHLKIQGVPMAVGTSSQLFRVNKVLDYLGIKKYFPTIVSADDVTKHKPEPDVFLEAGKRLGLPPQQCAVIEDAENGIEAANRAGMVSIGYLNGHNTTHDLRNADRIIGHFHILSRGVLEELMN